MRQYLIDELRPDDYEKLKDYLDKTYGSEQPVSGMYWIPLDPALADSVQEGHIDCQPYFFAVILEPMSISFELLLRTRKRVKCDCIHYADGRQRESIIALADSIFERLNLKS